MLWCGGFFGIFHGRIAPVKVPKFQNQPWRIKGARTVGFDC
jgi:hypothetical protein